MPTPYTFLSDEEPTDEQLQELIEAALVDVKARAVAANDKFRAVMEEQRKGLFRSSEIGGKQQ